MGSTGKLTVREAIQKLMTVDDLDAPLLLMNINDNHNEDDIEELAANSYDAISVSDNVEAGAVVLFYLGEMPVREEDESDVTDVVTANR